MPETTPLLPTVQASSPPLRHFSLANGLRVYLQQDPRAPIVTAQLWYHVGASYEPEGHSGLCHVLEHLIFQGSAKLTPSQYQNTIVRLGAEPDAYTTADGTLFEMSLAANRLETALEIMADSMQDATLGEAQFLKVLEVVTAERASQVDSSPTALALERANMHAYANNGYATPVIGHAADQRTLGLAEVRSWYASWFHPNNASLVVVGAIELDQLQGQVERQFSKLPSGDLPPRQRPILARPTKQQRFTVVQPHLDPGLMITFPVPSLATVVDAKYAYALALIDEILAGNHNARLPRTLVSGARMLSEVACDYPLMQRGDCVFSVHGSLREGVEVEAALASLWQQIEALREQALDERELARAKVRVLAAQVFQRDSRPVQAWNLGLQAVCEIDPSRVAQRSRVTQDLTAQDVLHAARHFLNHDSASVIVLLDQENNDE